MRKIILSLAVMALVAAALVGYFSRNDHQPKALEVLKEKYSKKHMPSVDHSQFTALKQNFTSPQQVTEACIACHNKRHTEVMQSNHWNWEREEYVPGRGIVYLGKKNAINNYCIGATGNEESCAKCHIGFGNQDELNLTSAANVDCLVCHDNSETYVKGNELGGAPVPSLELNKIAQSVSKPNRANCGVCHFYGGGGNNVKHGDLDMVMFSTTRDIDVHMGTDGANMVCVDCHTTDKHVISGKLYSLSSMNENRSDCEQCHTATPHEDGILNEHTIKVACQSCHIPQYAKANATKMYWDWSTAGKLKNGEPYAEEDSMGNHSYLSIKGSFVWEKNVTPDYIWFNGTASHYLKGDVIDDTTKPVNLNTLYGSYDDDNSKIIPVKIHNGKQPYDPINKILITPKLYAEKKGEGGFWKDFDWNTAAEKGMQEYGLPFSGKVSFIDTRMYWPVNHMVATKENTVSCNSCHTRENSRLEGLNDFYMPGRNYSPIVEAGGTGLIILTLLAVFIHGSIRIAAARKRRGVK